MTKIGPRDDTKLAAIKLEWWPRSYWNRWPPSLESAEIRETLMATAAYTTNPAERRAEIDGIIKAATAPFL
jgi:hypothetical protein